VLRAKYRHRAEGQHLVGRLWGHLQDLTTGYGYRPGRAAIWLAALLVVGSVAFNLRHPTPVPDSGNPAFNPVVYTLDLLLPLVDFGQERSFIPRGGYAWLAYGLIAAGWLLATTIAAGATRALRRD
jgi:hypothetical protein